MSHWTDWMSLAGGSVEVVGLTLAARGLAHGYRDFLGRSVCADLRSRTLEFLRLRRPRAVALTGRGTAVLTTTATARIRQGKLSENATVADRLARLEDYVQSIDDEVAQLQRSLTQRVKKIIADSESRLNSRFDELASEEKKLRELVTGRNGSGIRETFIGVMLALLGLALTIPSMVRVLGIF